MDSNSETPIRFRISKIQSIKFSFEDIDEKELERLLSTEEALGITFNVGLEYTPDQKNIRIDIHSRLFVRDSDLTLISHVGRTVFDVVGLKNAFNEKEQVLDLPTNFLVQLLSMSYTHARALLSIDLSPTVYRDKYFLPIVDPTKLLPNQDEKKIKT